MKLEIEGYTYPKLKIFDNDDNFSCDVENEIELYQVRVQIAEHSLEGYWFLFNGEKVTINSNGELSNWPYGMYDQCMILFAKLHNISKAKKIK